MGNQPTYMLEDLESPNPMNMQLPHKWQKFIVHGVDSEQKQRQKDYHYPKKAFLSCNSINSNWKGDIYACTSTSQEIKRTGQITSTVIRMMKIWFSSFSCSHLNFQFWSSEDIIHTKGYSEYNAISHHVEYELYVFSSHKGSEALL